ncbi:MAG: HAMP domain-containing histidine kinase [Cyanobacteria bacterium SZAS LIN-3]|nr:HAMP domain-containing histidine kinase [Cyanobacteria bacterium SZAS LIN-3]MBS2006039.1 HAMP domain-containing histidine kinase [Cyanobacteria bacterium SZAS TMP-1]
MQLRSSLSLKVLILVAMPLFVTWGFLFWLLSLQAESEKALERSFHARDVADSISRLRVDMYKVISAAGGERTMDPVNQTAAREHFQVIQKDYTELLALAADNEPLRKAVEDSRQNMYASLEALLEIKKSMEQRPDDFYGRKALWHSVRDHMTLVLKNDFSRAKAEQENIASISPAVQAEFRKKQAGIMITLAILTLVFTVGSAIFLTRGITFRLAKVSDNAYRLASDRPLNPVLSGGDEIAELDRTFHKMASALREAEQAKQEVVVMVTHDLRTPLATLQNILKFLRSGNYGRLDPKGTEYILVANRNVERMANLVNDLLDIEKVKSGLMTLDKQAFELFDCFTAARELAGAFADEVEVTIEVQETDALVNADQDRVTRVLANLMANAVKFSPRGGKVTVRAEEKGKWVYTSVDDQGPGIPAEQLETIFERFRQVENAAAKGKGGSGLGLTICQVIVELHGGKIWAENLPQRGTRFVFSLPAVD